MTLEDQELLLKALWQGTLHRQARGRGQQQPLFLMHIEYNDPFFRIGYIEDLINIKPEGDAWRANSKRPSSLKEIELDVSDLLKAIEKYKDKIARCRVWVNDQLKVIGEIDQYKQKLW